MSKLGGKVMSENTDADEITAGVVETIVAGTNIDSIDSSDPANPIVNAAAGSGETNTASNVGGETGTVFKQKAGVDLEFKTLKAGTNITINNNASDIEIVAAGGGGSTSGAHVRRDTDLPIVTTTDIVWQTESYDDDSFIDIGSDPTHITVPSGVTRVNISCNLKFTNTVTVGTNYILEIRHLNSSDALQERVAGQNGQWGTGAPNVSACALGVPVVATDYFEVRIFCSDTTVTIDHAQATIQDVS